MGQKMDLTEKERGLCSLKIAIAYERGLHFEKVTEQQAERVFQLQESDITPEDIRCFQDYLFWKICEIAAEVSLPFTMSYRYGTDYKYGYPAIK